MRAVMVATEPFAELARAVAEELGVADLPTLVVEHPLGGLDDEAVIDLARRAAPLLRTLLDG